MTRRTTLILTAALSAAMGCGKSRNAVSLVASGYVEATEVRISAKVPGRLQSFAVKEGDRVEEGQELARIDTTDIRLVLDQARAERGQAAAELRLRLAGARKEDIEELSAQVAAQEFDLTAAQRDLDRMEALLERGSGTVKARDDAGARRDVLAARLAGMKHALARMKAGFRVEEIDAARARLAAVEARIAQFEQQLRDARVVSPRAGVLTQRVAEPGELVQAGALLGVVVDLSDAWLTIYIGEPDLGRVRLGQEAEVRTDDGQVRQGRITYLSSEAEFTPKNVQTRDERVKLVFKAKVRLSNADGIFKPGMPAEARLAFAGAGK